MVLPRIARIHAAQVERDGRARYPFAMAERPPDIHIHDLSAPELTDLQKAAVAYAGQHPVELQVKAVLGQAQERTGLDDFGEDSFQDRLQVWLQAVREDAGLGPLGRLAVHSHCVRALANRLRFEDLLKRHPEVLQQEICRPIIVVGLPRSGTTHLLNLMSSDTRLRSLPYWESLEPVPDPKEAMRPDGRDPRLVRAEQQWALQDQQLPLLKAMHPMSPLHVHEEIELQELDFATYNLEWLARVPRWRDHYLALDMQPHYTYLKRVLQALQWMKPGERWVLKSPQHLEQLRPLHETFPDATFVITHRDPVRVIQSAVTMLAYGDRLRRNRLALPELGEYWVDRVERLLRACVRDRDVLPADQRLDVLFHEFMRDDLGTVERIYAQAGFPLGASVRTQLSKFVASHPRGKYGRVRYDLLGDFGLDPAQVRSRFAFYFDRFAIRTED